MAKFNEDTRVKIPATIQFLRLGYDYQSLKDIDLHTETRIAVNRFKPAIEKINGRSFSDEEIQAIIADILSVIKNNDLGKTFYKWLIHKYFYDKSIADGYTLRIKKESIETTARSEIKKNLDLENPTAAKSDIYESEDYIQALCKFIDKDFRYFRLTNGDDSIGGMIVCASNPQAKKIKRWFDEHSDLTAGLVISDEEIPTAANKATQIAFKETLQPDILVVHQMLTTGYDVNRLKKMYLLRNAKEHTLLQTISRVNRPYKSPAGKTYQYGYIVDFVDIEEEYDRTIEMYLKELRTISAKRTKARVL